MRLIRNSNGLRCLFYTICWGTILLNSNFLFASDFFNKIMGSYQKNIKQSLLFIESNSCVTVGQSFSIMTEYAIAATGAVRQGAASNAINQPDGVTTEIGHPSDYLVLTLQNELPIGTEYTIYISGRGGSATTDVWEASEGASIPSNQQNSPIGFTQNGQATGAQDIITQVTKTTQVATKYLYFDRGVGDIEIDAVSYTAVPATCEITITQSSQSACQDNGTPNIITDDYFTITINATGVLASAQYEVVLNANIDGTGGTVLGTANLGTAIVLGNGVNGSIGTFSADGLSTYTITVRDAVDNNCFENIETSALPNCTVMPTCNCTEYVYLNDEDLDLVHKFTIGSNQLTEVGNPWIPAGTIKSPHGLAQDNNGNLFIGGQDDGQSVVIGPVYQFNSEGEVLDSDFINPDRDHGFNFRSKDGIMYILSVNEEAVLAYDLCDGSYIGKMWIKNNGENILAWGFYTDDQYWYAANRFDGNIYQGALDVNLYTTGGAINATTIALNTGHSGLFSPMGITRDNAGNWYAVINEIDGSGQNVIIKKYDSNGNVLASVSRTLPEGQIYNVNNGEAGFWGARGLTYSPQEDKLYVSNRENCITVFDTDLNEIVIENIGNPTNGYAKGIDLVTECCPVVTNITIDTVFCYQGTITRTYLQDLIECEGVIAEGTWSETNVTASIIYEDCDNHIEIIADGGCATYTLQSDGNNSNAACGAFEVTVNVCSQCFTCPSIICQPIQVVKKIGTIE